MEASNAAAKLIEDYKSRKKRFGSQKATQKPIEAKARRPGPLLLMFLPLLIVPSLIRFPAGASTGFAVLDGRPLVDAEILITSEDGGQHSVSTDPDGDFVVNLPKGTYSFSLEGGAVGPKCVKIHPGMNFRVSFSNAPLKDKHLTSGGNRLE